MYVCVSNTVGNQTFTIRKWIHEEPKGVLLDKTYDYYICTLDNDIKNAGVRKDNKMYYYRPKQNGKGVNFDKPCVCGSLQHATIRHLDCPLNRRYDDV